MKKMILAAAIIFAAAVTQAAAVGWTCAGATAYANGSYSVFVIGLNGVTGADQIKAIVAAGGLSSADSYALYKGGSIAANGAATLMAASSPASITYSGSGVDSYDAFIVVQDKDGTKASYSATANVTMDNNSTSKTFGFAQQSASFTANNFTVNTPEPTSGLLLLLGMAGLALKRKRA